MDITEIRHRNLLYVLTDVLPDRGIVRTKDAAQALGGLGSSYLSQLKGGKKLGDDTARKIEAALRWRHGEFDTPRWNATGEVRDPAPPYRTDPESSLSTRERALLENYRAADERTKHVVDAAAAAGAQPAIMAPKRKARSK